MTHLELMEKVFDYTQNAGLAARELLQFEDYIAGIKKAINPEGDHFLRNKIKQRIIDKQGCKITELAAEVDLIEEAHNKNINFVDEIYGMIRDGELVEVEYILPNLNFRIKSYLFPVGTEVRLGNEHELIMSLNAQIAEYKREQY